tara:strand:- start:137 stop:424 length:288 start_codon:yes stop_codon:yes gene_type:complete
MSELFNLDTLLGPTGGALALSFAAGASSGWAFAQRTVMHWAKKQIERMEVDAQKRDSECDAKISDLRKFFDEIDAQRKEHIERLEHRLSMLEGQT